MADLVELEIVDFDIILGMDWLHACYTSIDCRARVVKFQILNEPIIECASSLAEPKGHFFSYFKARNLISKGCICHLVRVNESCFEVPSLQSVPRVNEFPELYPDDLLGVSCEREIDFGIDVIQDTRPTFIRHIEWYYHS